MTGDEKFPPDATPVQQRILRVVPQGKPLRLHAPFRLSPETQAQIAALIRSSAEASRVFGEAARRMSEAVKKIGPVLDKAGLIPDEPPTDPRERALWARQHRNTGPTRDPHRHRGIR